MSTTRNAGHQPHHAVGGVGDHLGDAGGQGAVTALLGHLDTWDKLLVVAGAVSRNHQPPFASIIGQSMRILYFHY